LIVTESELSSKVQEEVKSYRVQCYKILNKFKKDHTFLMEAIQRLQGLNILPKNNATLLLDATDLPTDIEVLSRQRDGLNFFKIYENEEKRNTRIS
jgi:hypothetical protein